ncbi:MAG: PrsW family intramembrane metalloprotease [Verrucomicrobiota bacterium]|nr:PrsW family intramembrane metalloprotease [Verrucomicrobiota bacterium]
MPQSGTVKWLLAVAAGLTALFLGLLTLALQGLSTGFLGLGVGMVLALLPLPFYMLLVLWIDRFEKEPFWMLAAAFVWGAMVASFFAFVLNTLFDLATTAVVPAYGHIATAIISAPFIEELAKGTALIVFYFWRKDEFDGVLDGIIYAAMIGLGFAMMENISYYGRSLAAGGFGASVFTFILRGVVSPFAHPLFTSMTGIGLGLAQLARTGSPMKFFGPVIGLGFAMFLHALWNLSATFGILFFVAYVLVMVPAFLGLLVLIFISLRKEGRIVREHLFSEFESGLLEPREYEALCSTGGRLGQSWQAITHGGFRSWRRSVRFHEAASELAFHRWRTSRGIFPRYETPLAREAAYLHRLQTMKEHLRHT